MIAQQRGECVNCPGRIRAGESIARTDDGWAHVRCPRRVVLVCECGMETPCDCGDNELRRAS